MKKLLLLALFPAFTWAASGKIAEEAGQMPSMTPIGGAASTSAPATTDVYDASQSYGFNPAFFTPEFAKWFLESKPSLAAREAYLSILCPFAFRALPREAKTLYFPQGMYAVRDADSSYDYLVTGGLHGCTALVLHNASTKKVAFVHIDHVSRLESLEPLLKNIGFSKTPEGYKGPAKSKVTVFQYTSTERAATVLFKKAFDATRALFHRDQDIRITTSEILSHRFGFSGTQSTFFKGFPMAEKSFAVDKEGNMYNTCLMQGDVLKMGAVDLPFGAFRETCEMNIAQMPYLRFGTNELLINLMDRTSTKYDGWGSLPESWKNLFLCGKEQQMRLAARIMRTGADYLDLLLATRSWDFPLIAKL